MPTHETEGYVCAKTMIINTQYFTFIAACIETGSGFDASRLEDMITSMAPPHLIYGDVNAHHEIWGTTHTSSRRKNYLT